MRVCTFKSYSGIPKSRIVMMIKNHCSERELANLKKTSRLLYCPIDHIADEQHLRSIGWLLRGCDAVAVHCERLGDMICKINKRVFFVEHHDKFSVVPKPYKKDGYVLWVGGFQYVPFLINHLSTLSSSLDVMVLSDMNNENALRAARKNAQKIGLNMVMVGDRVCGIPVTPWSESNQKTMMNECKSAMDIKLVSDFNQMTKPPTKAQKYVCSGIPTAVNRESYSHEYFAKRGLNLPSPSETSRWFSEQFHAETIRYSAELRKRLSLPTVAEDYRKIMSEVLTNGI